MTNTAFEEWKGRPDRLIHDRRPRRACTETLMEVVPASSDGLHIMHGGPQVNILLHGFGEQAIGSAANLYNCRMSPPKNLRLRRGWTTGACATAATRSAYAALLTGEFPDPVTITLPKGQRPSFALAFETLGPGFARTGIVKDAGDDPDVTHLALVESTVREGAPGTGVEFRAGEGVGTVTRPGLPLAVGEPAINPVPRRMMREAVADVAAAYGGSGDVVVEVGVRDGERLAERTWNPRLGIVGGLSILGTTGIVIPYSCSAWIHSIHRGVDVARAVGLPHVAGCTGSTSEEAVRALYGLPLEAMIDMGDFAGGFLKYLRRHPVPRVSIGGGFAKISKLAEGHLDLHSARSRVDCPRLAQRAADLGADAALCRRIGAANSAAEALGMTQGAGVPLAGAVAHAARETAHGVARGTVEIDVVIVDRNGTIVARSDA